MLTWDNHFSVVRLCSGEAGPVLDGEDAGQRPIELDFKEPSRDDAQLFRGALV